MFDKCATCAHSGKDCIPHLMALAATDLITWCKERKKILDLSNAVIAERSGVPKGTIDRIFGKEIYTEFRFTTIQPILRVLTGCTEKDLECAEIITPDQKLINENALLKEHIEGLEKENAYLKGHEKRYEQDFDKMQAQYQDNTKALRFLLRLRLKIIIILSVLLAIALAVIIAALIVDKFNPEKGFFWRTVTAFFSGIKGNMTL